MHTYTLGRAHMKAICLEIMSQFLEYVAQRSFASSESRTLKSQFILFMETLYLSKEAALLAARDFLSAMDGIAALPTILSYSLSLFHAVLALERDLCALRYVLAISDTFRTADLKDARLLRKNLEKLYSWMTVCWKRRC
jgi:hypothetical protein